MNEPTLKLLAALHAMQHVLLSLEAEEVTPVQADRDMADIACRMPKLDRQWRQSLDI